MYKVNIRDKEKTDKIKIKSEMSVCMVCKEPSLNLHLETGCCQQLLCVPCYEKCRNENCPNCRKSAIQGFCLKKTDAQKLVSLILEANQEFFTILKGRIEKVIPNAELAIKTTIECLILKARLVPENTLLLSLPPTLDQIWHEMILNTRQYVKICVAIGKFLDHTTFSDQDSDEQKNGRIAILRSEHEREFGPIAEESIWMTEDQIVQGSSRRLPKRNIKSKYQGKRKKRRIDPTFAVFVKMLTGKTIWIENLTPQTPVAILKLLVQRKDGIPKDLQRLIYAGRNLDDRLTLGDYMIRDEATIHLVARVRGC